MCSKYKKLVLCEKHIVEMEVGKSVLPHNYHRYCPECIAEAKELEDMKKVCDKKSIDYWARPANIYYIYFPDFNLYKIGIAANTAKRRIELGPESILLKEWQYSTREEAYNTEQSLLSKYAEYKYTGFPVLTSGNTELFTKDVLNYRSEDNIKSVLTKLADKCGYAINELVLQEL